MKPPIERATRVNLTDSGAAALDAFARRAGMSETDAVNVLIQVADHIHEELGDDGELLIRRPDGSVFKLNINSSGKDRWGR